MADIFNEDNLDAEKAFSKNIGIDVQFSADIFSEHPDKPDIFRADYTKAMREIAEQENLPTLKTGDKEIVFWEELSYDDKTVELSGIDIKTGSEYIVPKQTLLSDEEITSEDLDSMFVNPKERNKKHESASNIQRFTDELGYYNRWKDEYFTNKPETLSDESSLVLPNRIARGTGNIRESNFDESDMEIFRQHYQERIRQQKQNEENPPEQAPDVIKPEQPEQNIEPEQPKQPEPLQAFGMINTGRGAPTILAQDPESGTVYGARQTRSGRVSYTPLSTERVESLRARAEEGDPRVQISPNIRFDEEGRVQQVQAENNKDIQPPPNIPNIGQADGNQQNEIVRLAPGTKFQYDPETGILSLM